jgi:hypothetical protein
MNRYAMCFLLAGLMAMPLLAFGTKLCPDNKYHADGQCRLCPDGTYTTAPKCTLAPDGKYHPDYGRGTVLTPKGSYIPNTGHQVLCPDGNYYPGKSCKLLPDGRYAGVQ